MLFCIAYYTTAGQNQTGRRMQSEMKSAVASPKNRYNASSVLAAARRPAAAAAVGETVPFEAYANRALLFVGWQGLRPRIDEATDKKLAGARFFACHARRRQNRSLPRE